MLIFRKAIVALTGLFICLFLTVHLGGNLILLLPASEAMPLYNSYSASLASNPFIKVIAYVNYACFGFHILYGLLISWKNQRSRDKPYAMIRSHEVSNWSSRNMGLLGTMLLVFLIIHLANFWYKIKFGEADTNLYAMVVSILGNPYFAGLYFMAMIPLGLHLSHGIASAFRSLGFYHKRYLSWIARAGVVYSIIVSVGFALIPIVLFMRSSP